MNPKLKGVISTHTAVILFGSAGVFGKMLSLSPLLIVFGRVAFSALFLTVFNLVHQQKHANPKGCDRLLILLSGLVLAIHWISFFHAIQVSSVAVGLLSFATFPVFSVFLEPLLLKERFNWKFLYLFIAIFAGLRIMVMNSGLTESSSQGIIWGVFSGMLFALLIIINRGLGQRYPPIVLALWQNCVSFVVLFPITLSLLPQITEIKEWVLLLILGVVFTAFSHTLFIEGLKWLNARAVSVIASMEPIYGVAIAALVVKEIPELRVLLGGLIIVLTVLYLSSGVMSDNL